MGCKSSGRALGSGEPLGGGLRGIPRAPGGGPRAVRNAANGRAPANRQAPLRPLDGGDSPTVGHDEDILETRARTNENDSKSFPTKAS